MVKMKTNYNELIKNVLINIGGKENISEVTHCITRLRIRVLDDTRVNSEEIKKNDNVLGVVKKGDQYQVVIGPDVANVYKAFVDRIGDIRENRINTEEIDVKEKASTISNILNTIAGIFNPIVPALAGAGLIKAILALLVSTNLLVNDSTTYTVLNTISDGVFTFLPFLLAYSSAKIFKMNGYVAVAIAAAMLHPNFTDLMASGISKIEFIGLPMNIIKYTGSVLPIVLTVWFASYIERFLDRYTPKALKIIIVPAFTLLIATPIALITIGPLAQVLGEYLANGVSLLFEKGGIFAGIIYGGVYSAMVVTGLQHGMVPILVDGISRNGFNYISPVSGSANMAQAGAAFGVWLKTKDKNTKTVAASATISAISGVTEPAIYGVNLRLKKPFLSAIIGGMAGGAVAALFHAKSYAMGGPSFLTLPMFIGDPGNVWYVAIAFSVAFIVSAVATYILGFEENPVEYTTV